MLNFLQMLLLDKKLIKQKVNIFKRKMQCTLPSILCLNKVVIEIIYMNSSKENI